ncbi:NAD(P)-binding protein [Martensiomyces pterosporus]|nr:NAD(P)-binding protein [Martensiomyces pterosporus]
MGREKSEGSAASNSQNLDKSKAASGYAVSNWWHAAVCAVLSLLPKARVSFPVNKPSGGYHPAVLVTGTSSGIGHDTAVALASSGYTVFAGVRCWEDGAQVENDFLNAVKPQNISKNRWTQPSWLDRLLDGKEAREEHMHQSQGDEYLDADTQGACEEAQSLPQARHMHRRQLSRRRQQKADGRQPKGKANGTRFDPHGLGDYKEPLSPGYMGMLREMGTIIPVILDVSSKDSIDRAYEKVQSELDQRKIPLVALVNNAGVTAFGPMDIAGSGYIDHCMAVNFLGPVRVAQKFMPLLRASSGRIVNISSVMSWLIGPGFGVYCASKAALSAASRAWHYELANNNISVSVLEPGLTRTSLWKKVETQLKFHHSRLNGIPLPREGPQSIPDAMPGDEAVASISPAESPSRPASPSSDEPMASEDQSLYNPMIRRIQTSNELAPIFALPTHHAVSAILHALTSRYPKSTYRVGWDARWMGLATWLASEEVVEWLCRVIGIVSED